MKVDPQITIPLSEYNRLINIETQAMQKSITVGQRYIFDFKNKSETWFCKAYDIAGFHFIGDSDGDMGRERLSIRIKK